MGWFWFIPTFHMTHPRPSSDTDTPVTFHLTRKEIDFPLGIGSNIIDVEVTMKWCAESADVLSPPSRQESTKSGDTDPDGSATAAVQSAIGGTGQGAVEAAQVGSE
jgi:phosphatidylinositol-3,4,5-trisphosphate 3-phosphatase and dual-specificity protein phosphatase PTEN